MKYVDVIVIGAGFSGIYMSYQLRENGFSVQGFEKADGVGGVWYYSRYPGAKCDSESIFYNFTFSKDLYEKWSWSARYAGQNEILRYLNFVADELDIKRHFQFNTEVTAAKRLEDRNLWLVETADGTMYTCQYLISAVGCLSTSNIPNIPGRDQFKGESYHTGHWPHEPVELKGKRIGVIGTGSSGVQTVPEVAKYAEHVYVFQRTPQYTAPAHNRDFTEEDIQKYKSGFEEMRIKMRESGSGLPFNKPSKSALSDSPEERQATYEKAWQSGGMAMTHTYSDLSVNEESNETISQFVRDKISEIVEDPDVRQKLLPDYYFGTKRPIVNTNYYESYNLPNVSLVSLREEPIQEITETGIQTTTAHYPLDMIIFATGYDAMTGTLLKLNIQGTDGKSIREQWDNGKNTETYLGLGMNNFPNFFTITGPQSPSVLTNMPIAIEQHVEWITDLLLLMRNQQLDRVEVTKEAQKKWTAKCLAIAESTLFLKTDSWYTGANVEGKPKGFLIYLAGLDTYRATCNEVVENNYQGFTLSKVEVPNEAI